MNKKYYDEDLKFKAKQAKLIFGVSLLLITVVGTHSYFNNSTSSQMQFIFFKAMFSLPLLFIVLKFGKLNLFLKNFGDTYLELDPDPGSIGGQIGGIIRLQTNSIKNEDELKTLKIEIACFHYYAISSGSTQWEGDALLNLAGLPKEFSKKTDINGKYYFTIPFIFDLPQNFPSSHKSQDSQIVWKILLKKENSVLYKFELSFEIPVDKVHRLSQLKVKPFNVINRIQEQEQISIHEIEQLKIALNESSIKRSLESNVLTYYFPNFRFKKLSFLLLIFSSILISILISANFHFILFIFAVIFTSALFLTLFNSLKIDIDKKQIKSTRTLLFFYKIIKNESIEDLTKLDIVLSYTVDKGIDEFHFFKIKGLFAGNRELTIAEGVPHKRNAEVMKKEILDFIQK
jgi:hypothetical protein